MTVENFLLHFQMNEKRLLNNELEFLSLTQIVEPCQVNENVHVLGKNIL